MHSSAREREREGGGGGGRERERERERERGGIICITMIVSWEESNVVQLHKGAWLQF